MHKRTLLSLWAVAVAFGLSYGEGAANPSHGGSHPNPKSHPPGNKGGNANAKSFTPANKDNVGNANAKSSTPADKGGANTAKKTPHDAAGTQHQAHKDSIENKQKELHADKERQEARHKEKELREKEMRKELARRAKLEAELARLDHLLREEHHRRYAMNNPYQSRNGQQQSSHQQQNGQQQSPTQQNGSTGGPGGSGSGQPQVAQEQETPSETPRPGLASEAFQDAEKLVLAAIHQLEEAFARDGGHRHHSAEAHHMLDEAARRIEVAANGMRAHEHPRMEAASKHTAS